MTKYVVKVKYFESKEGRENKEHTHENAFDSQDTAEHYAVHQRIEFEVGRKSDFVSGTKVIAWFVEVVKREINDTPIDIVEEEK